MSVWDRIIGVAILFGIAAAFIGLLFSLAQIAEANREKDHAHGATVAEQCLELSSPRACVMVCDEMYEPREQGCKDRLLQELEQ